MDSPVIKRGSNVADGHANFWCYFCSSEFPRHLVFDGEFYLQDAGLLDHISSSSHKLATDKFFRKNHIRRKSVESQTSVSISVETKRISAESKNSGTIMADYYKSTVQKKLKADIGTCNWKEWLSHQHKPTKSKTVDDVDSKPPRLDPVEGSGASETLSPLSCCQKSSANSNLIEAKMEWFMISESDFHRFRDHTKNSIAEHFNRLDQKLNQEKQQIVVVGEKRRRMVQYYTSQHMQMQFSSSPAANRLTTSSSFQLGMQVPAANVSRPGQAPLAAVRTIAAHGEGLTCIKIPKLDEFKGNVHSGALPPWLQSSTPSGSEAVETALVIGPTADDLAKHVASERKRKLPAERVGADFDRRGTPQGNWMPSFGRVWSSSRRSHQQGQFAHNFTREHQPRMSSSSSRESRIVNTASGYEVYQSSLQHSEKSFSAPNSSYGNNCHDTLLKQGTSGCVDDVTGNVAICGKYQRKRPSADTLGIAGRLNISTNLL